MSLGQLPDKPISQSTTATAVPLHRFSVEEYHRMAGTGAFRPDARVELLDGLLIDMYSISPRHRFCVQATSRLLSKCIPSCWTVFTQQPITLSTSEPQPDVTVLRGRNADYKDRHPGGTDLGLVVEIADSSLELDRNQKLAIYGAAAIPQYWIVNLVDREVECYVLPHRSPDASTALYPPPNIIPETGSLTLVLDGQPCGSIAVADLLP